jgi:hypothetical protein
MTIERAEHELRTLIRDRGEFEWVDTVIERFAIQHRLNISWGWEGGDVVIDSIRRHN